jgi:uncharacterized protein YwgA
MNALDRVDKLCTLVSSTPGQVFDSRKRLHKTVYLLQMAGENFDYDFSYGLDSGIISHSLSQDIEIAKSRGLLLENEDGEKGIEIHLSRELPQKTFPQKTSKLITILSKEDRRTLHVLADIHFTQQNGYKEKELEEKVRKLNQYYDLQFFSRAFELDRELKDYFPLAPNSL